ncbi:MAG: TetR/AcrR family transcriptional regulator [bacterium]|nr:TetR/AcrR family transcriptional regulator [bacterium]
MKKGERRKEHILECAQTVFAEKGYYETQVSDIVKVAKIAKGTIYQYFKNKEDVFLSLLNIYLDAWAQEMTLDIKDFVGGGPAIDYAKAFASQRVGKSLAYFDRDHERCKIVLRMGPGLNASIESAIKLFEEQVTKVISHDIELAKRQGHIDKNIDVELACTALVGSILRISYQYFVLKEAGYQSLDLQTLTSECTKLVENTLGMGHQR